MIGMDVATGLAAAGMYGELSSKVAREGLMHKIAYLACVVLGYILDNAQTLVDLGLPFQLQDLVCYYIIMCETLSCVENIARLNPELRNTPLLKLFIGTQHEVQAERLESGVPESTKENEHE